MNKHENHKHDYYVNPHVIKPMINMIAKQTVRTQNNSPYSTWVSQNAIHACHGSNNHGIYMIITKHQNML